MLHLQSPSGLSKRLTLATPIVAILKPPGQLGPLTLYLQQGQNLLHPAAIANHLSHLPELGHWHIPLTLPTLI